MCRSLYSLTLEPREVHLHKGHLLQKSCADVTLRWKMKMYFLVNKKKIHCNLEEWAVLCFVLLDPFLEQNSHHFRFQYL